MNKPMLIDKTIDQTSHLSAYIYALFSDKFLEVGVKNLLSRHFKTLVSIESDPESMPLLVICDKQSLLNLTPKMRYHIMRVSAIIIFHEKSLEKNMSSHVHKNRIVYVDKRIRPSELLLTAKKIINMKEKNKSTRYEIGASLQHSALTKSEIEILRYLSVGLTQQKISEILSLSPKTISFHKKNAMRKLDLGSNIELFYWLCSGELDGVIFIN